MSDFRRRTVIAKKPYDAEIKYLESTGTQYINTGVLVDGQDYDIGLDFSLDEIPPVSSAVALFGTNNNYATGYPGIICNSSGKFRYGNQSIAQSIEYVRDTRYQIKLTWKSLEVNGTTYTTTNSTNWAKSTKPLILFARYNQTIIDLYSKMKVHSFYVKKNGIYLIDYIPVRVGQVGYMYDKVSKRLFGNAGTGDFILGYDAEIEYLEGSGEQYIDTSVVPNPNTRIECKYAFKEYNNNQVVFGCTDSPTTNDAKNGIVNLHLSSNMRRFGVGNGDGTLYDSNVLSEPNTEYVIYFDKNAVYVDNTLINTFPTSEWSTNKKLYLFARNSTSKYPLYGYIKYCKIWDGETLVRDYIPVRIGTVGYMYDKVRGKLYGNSGTGNFILGRDISYDAEIEYLESDGNQWIDTKLSAMESYVVDCKFTSFSDTIQSIIGAGVTNPSSYNTIWFDMRDQYKKVKLYYPNRSFYDQTNYATFAQNGTYSIEVTLADTCKCIKNGTEITLTKVSLSAYGEHNIPYTLHLLNLIQNNSNVSPFIGRIYKFSVKSNTTSETLMDLIPVRVGTVGYMYDKVSGKLFGNSGTGKFIIPQEDYSGFAKLILNDDTTVEISGSGALSQEMVSGHTTNCVGLVCGTLCTSIEANTFENFSNLVYIELKSSKITTIKDYGFHGCSKLYKVTLPNTITSIGRWSFGGCKSLTTFNIPSSLKTIGYWAFSSCTSLKSIVIPSTVTTVGAYAFQQCSGLTKMELYSMVTVSYKTISEGMCIYCTKLESIVIPYGITGIGSHSCFKNCYALESVSIPNTVSAIGRESFRNCRSLPSVTIPSSVTSIGNLVFENCTSLTSVTCLAITPPTLGTNSFNGNASGRKIYVPSESVEAYKTATNWSTYANDILPIPTE